MTPKQKIDLAGIAAHMWRDDLPLCKFYATAIAHMFDGDSDIPKDIQAILEADKFPFYDERHWHKVERKSVCEVLPIMHFYHADWHELAVDWSEYGNIWPLEHLYGN